MEAHAAPSTASVVCGHRKQKLSRQGQVAPWPEYRHPPRYLSSLGDSCVPALISDYQVHWWPQDKGRLERMSSAGRHKPSEATADDATRRLAVVVLARLAADETVTLAQVARDVAPLAPAADGQPVAAWRREVERVLCVLEATGFAVRRTQAWEVSPAGKTSLAGYLGSPDPLPGTWAAMRDGPLVTLALGLNTAPAARRRSLAKIDGLQQQILIGHWQLKIRGKPTAARVRQALALVALQRAFGDGLSCSGLDAKTGLSSRAGRALAAQLAVTPKEFGTDGRLIAALAAQAVGARRAVPAQLCVGAIRGYLGNVVQAASLPKATASSPAPRIVAARVLPQSSQQQSSRQRPTPEQFAEAVKSAAVACAEGWSGNRRAFVSQVWGVVQRRHAGWGVSEIEFKAMLAEAHRRGLIVLANADLKDKQRLEDVQASAVAYKNTVWHYVRVEDVSQ